MAVLRLNFVFFCVFTVTLATVTSALESWESTGVRVAIKVYDECSKSDGFSPCLKKKALTFFNRLNHMDKLAITDELVVVKSDDKSTNDTTQTDEQLENSLPKELDARDAALDSLLYDKVSTFIGTRTIRFTMPKLSINDLGLDEEARGKKNKNMFGGMMMGMAGKMAALIPVAIAGLYLLAGKALITAKIALLIIGIIILKKIVAAKNGGGGGGGGGLGGGHGGWQSSGGGGGWDKRAFGDPQQMAYSAYAPQ